MLDTVKINHVQHISFTQSRLTDAVSVILSELLSYEHPSNAGGGVLYQRVRGWLVEQPRHIAFQVLEVELPGFLREVRQGLKTPRGQAVPGYEGRHGFPHPPIVPFQLFRRNISLKVIGSRALDILQGFPHAIHITSIIPKARPPMKNEFSFMGIR